MCFLVQKRLSPKCWNAALQLEVLLVFSSHFLFMELELQQEIKKYITPHSLVCKFA